MLRGSVSNHLPDLAVFLRDAVRHPRAYACEPVCLRNDSELVTAKTRLTAASGCRNVCEWACGLPACAGLKRTTCSWRGNHGIDSSDHRALAARRSASQLAVQYGLGILPKRRLGTNPADPDYFAFNGQVVIPSTTPGPLYRADHLRTASERRFPTQIKVRSLDSVRLWFLTGFFKIRPKNR